MVKLPWIGMVKYWIFWAVWLLIIAAFLIVVFWAFGHFIVGH